MTEKLKQYVLVQPCASADEPDAHRVILKVGSQQFVIGRETCDTKEDAEWFASMFVTAVEAASQPNNKALGIAEDALVLILAHTTCKIAAELAEDNLQAIRALRQQAPANAPNEMLDLLFKARTLLKHHPAMRDNILAKDVVRQIDALPDQPSYSIASDSITCHTCGMTSWNPKDVERRYCGHCHVFHEG